MHESESYRFNERCCVEVMCLVEVQQTWQVWKLILSYAEANLSPHLDLVDDVMTHFVVFSATTQSKQKYIFVLRCISV